MIADSITLDGEGEKLVANGRPYADVEKKSYSLSGGSGGYIYVKTINFVRNNTLSSESLFSA